MERNRFKFYLDIGMAAMFALLLAPKVTSLAFHEIVGIVWGGAILLHLVLNIKWVIEISKKLFAPNTNRKAKFSYVLNIILLIDMLVILISGLLISEIVLPNFRYFTNIWWLPIHVFSSFLGLVIVGIHVGLHWNWIMQIGARLPKLSKVLFSQDPNWKLIIRTLLIVGTVALLVQIPRQVVNTHQEYQAKIERTITVGVNHEQASASKEPFSYLQLLRIVPVLIVHTSILGAVAFYIYLLERRLVKKRIKVPQQN